MADTRAPQQSLITDLLLVAAHFAGLALSRIHAGRMHSSEWRVVATLGQFGTMTGKAISQHNHLHKTKVSRALAGLEARKLVSRTANEEDLRESLVSLTPAGRKMYAELAPLARNFEMELLKALDPGDRAALERALTRIAEASQQLAAPARPPGPKAVLRGVSPTP